MAVKIPTPEYTEVTLAREWRVGVTCRQRQHALCPIGSEPGLERWTRTLDHGWIQYGPQAPPRGPVIRRVFLTG